MAVDAWGNTDSFAEAIISSQCSFSAIPDFQERTNALLEVFYMWSYWSRLWALQELELASRDMYISKFFFLQLGTLSVPQGMLKEQLLRLRSLVRLTLLSCALLREYS